MNDPDSFFDASDVDSDCDSDSDCASDVVICNQCTKYLNSVNGLKIHETRMHSVKNSHTHQGIQSYPVTNQISDAQPSTSTVTKKIPDVQPITSTVPQSDNRMSETNQDFAYDDSDALKQNMAVLFDNPDHGDTTFIIGDNKLYAWSGLISVASPKLGDIIKKNFENCHDREIKLYQVKNFESFSLVLKYIYGISINFSQTSLVVVCEALKHSVNYQLNNLSKNLTEYLSKINSFSLDSAVVLLNTANEFRIKKLYDQVKIFAYKNSNQLLKHPRFQSLDYTVLVELLKSDWFYSSEIDILKGVLHWHSDMDKERMNMKETLEKEKVMEDVNNIENEGESSIKRQHTEYETNLDSVDGDECLKIKKRKMNVNNESLCSTVNEETEMTVPQKKEKCLQTVQFFSENVLISLLGHIRILHISGKDMLDAFMTIQFKNYSQYSHLLAVKYFSQNCERRKKIEAMHVQHEVKDITKIYNVMYILNIYIVEKKLIKSEEDLIFGDFVLTCDMDISESDLPSSRDSPIKCFELDLYLCCESTSTDQKDWECYVECKLTVVSHLQESFPDLVLPSDAINAYISLVFTQECTCTAIGTLVWCGSMENWLKAYTKSIGNGNQEYFTFSVKFKSIIIKTVPTEKDLIGPMTTVDSTPYRVQCST